MAGKTVKAMLKDALANLDDKDLKRFCGELVDRREEPLVPLNKVKGKDFMDVADVLVSTFTEKRAVRTAEEIMRRIGCSEVAERLVKEAAGQSEDMIQGASQFNMSAKDTLRSKKTSIQRALRSDRRLILDKVYEKNLITEREYDSLNCITGKDEETRVAELVDKIMSKGEERCQDFIDLLQTDEEIKETYPELSKLKK